MSIRPAVGTPTPVDPVPIEPAAPASRRWRLPAWRPSARYPGLLLMGVGGLLVLLAVALYRRPDAPAAPDHRSRTSTRPSCTR